MTKINREEYEILRRLDSKWEWIVRDKWSRWADMYDRLPESPRGFNWWFHRDEDTRVRNLPAEAFKFVQWEDEPYNIAELINEYEGSDEHRISLASERSDQLWENIQETSREEGEENV